ncbi:LysR substrate-binding domain-containing protein [Undibacterium sp.]|uniref:LysR family transcriptional regulator n=1 Tax=Undibacterium sp. TaxID=1914977 RepID=UPI00374D6FBB
MIDALHMFVSVVELGNFSRAAKAQDLAVSSVTRKIDWLEAELGASLFNRSNRLLHLTDAGEKFLPRARTILAELAEARDAVSELYAEPRGVLSVSAPATFGRRHVAMAVGSFLQRYPLLEVDLQVSDRIVDLAAERVDVAIRIGVLPDSDLQATRLAPQRRVACASPAYLARCGIPAKPEELLQHNCLTMQSAAGRIGWWRFHGVNGNKPLPIKGSLRSDDSDALMQAALAGLGIAHLATWLVSDDIAAGRLLPLFTGELLHPPLTDSAIHAVRVPGRSPAKAKLFIEHLRACFGTDTDTPYWEQPFFTEGAAGA